MSPLVVFRRDGDLHRRENVCVCGHGGVRVCGRGRVYGRVYGHGDHAVRDHDRDRGGDRGVVPLLLLILMA